MSQSLDELVAAAAAGRPGLNVTGVQAGRARYRADHARTDAETDETRTGRVLRLRAAAGDHVAAAALRRRETGP